VYLPIEQHLLVEPGVRFSDIREVHSHHMALQQCMDYLGQHSWKLVETEDTALSAKYIHQKHSKHTAAVASALAAELFQLEILVPNIHTQKNNYTRFLILQPKTTALRVQNANKASIQFSTNHLKGSLAKVLAVIAEQNINLSKLQSMPIAGTNFKYSFHADLEFEDVFQFEEIYKNLESVTEQLEVYGIYNNGNIHK
jgi:prephenate dehydratase